MYHPGLSHSPNHISNHISLIDEANPLYQFWFTTITKDGTTLDSTTDNWVGAEAHDSLLWRPPMPWEMQTAWDYTCSRIGGCLASVGTPDCAGALDVQMIRRVQTLCMLHMAWRLEMPWRAQRLGRLHVAPVSSAEHEPVSKRPWLGICTHGATTADMYESIGDNTPTRPQAVKCAATPSRIKCKAHQGRSCQLGGWPGAIIVGQTKRTLEVCIRMMDTACRPRGRHARTS